ncbi:MAG: hypothetical protein Q8O09_04640 [Bacillota bacterium]|nr:hypothetical protein [Bacillota bacterium]
MKDKSPGEAPRENARAERASNKRSTKRLADQPREQHWNEIGREGNQGQGWGRRKNK